MKAFEYHHACAVPDDRANSTNQQGATPMKVYTSAIRLASAEGRPVYIHTHDLAWDSNVDATTHKRDIVAEDNLPRVNFSFQGEDAEGDKVYTVMRRLAKGVYQNIDDTFYPTRIAATRALRILRDNTGDQSLVINSLRL